MYVCRECLEREFDAPKWADGTMYSGGACEICNKNRTCIDMHHSAFVVKEQKTEWKCANPDCDKLIHKNDDVIEIIRSESGLISFEVAIPNPRSIWKVEYAHSARCAEIVLTQHMVRQPLKPKPNRFDIAGAILP